MWACFCTLDICAGVGVDPGVWGPGGGFFALCVILLGA
jgi:hypothetical protein